VEFESFIDSGHESHAFYNMPTAPASLVEKLSNPDLLLLPQVIKAHLENHFPSLVMVYAENGLGKVAQIHLFVPESKTRTRTYVLMYGLPKHRIFKVLGKKFLNFAKVVIEQDTDILGKIYPNTPQQIKLNNEVGIDWVRRNFESWPEIGEPNLSK
jgi:hypothetical protein